MLKEFRDFAMKGNVVDLAVGVIIGRQRVQGSLPAGRPHHAVGGPILTA